MEAVVTKALEERAEEQDKMERKRKADEWKRDPAWKEGKV